jgi:hypothetical protein
LFSIRVLGLVVVCLLAGRALAQDRVDTRLIGDRIVLVVPIVGSGTMDDPKRPLFAPRPGQDSPFSGYSWVPSDNGRLAIVMLVVKDPVALQDTLSDSRIVKAFQKGRQRRADIEEKLKKLKQDFDLTQLLGGVR